MKIVLFFWIIEGDNGKKLHVSVNNQVKLDKLKKKGFPINMKVAFNHPTLSNDGIVIFIGSDIPHLIKNIW